jgi:hypothetical protein
MVRRKHTVDDWRRAVFASPDVSDPTRVLLLLLADHMGPDLKVSVARPKLAKQLARSERRVADRFREAVGEMPGQDPNKRLLDRVVRGQKHVQAVYQGLMPNALSVTDGGHAEKWAHHDAPQHPENAGNRHGENASSGSQQDTRGSRLTRAEPTREGTDPSRSSNERPCRWHGHEQPCPADCADHPDNRRESA